MIGIIAGLGLLTVVGVLAWKASQGLGITLPGPSKSAPGSMWQPQYGETRMSDAMNPALPGKASHIVESGRLVRGYDPPHMGLDISAPMGTPIYAAKDGRVVFAGRAPGYGISVGISHGPNESTWYAHLNQQIARVGLDVYGGQVIGEVGRTSEGPEAFTTDWGRRMGAHLHFEVHPTSSPRWQYQNAARISPSSWLRIQGIEAFGRRW
jgi:murein DD-endopeptidase MepM/ murein hydrolase activator NlpD